MRTEFTTIINGKVERRPLSIPSDSKICDILVIGCGSAGCYAAIAAARKGCSVLAIEAQRNIGGMSVNGRVSGYYYGFSGGTFEEVETGSEKRKDLFPGGKYSPDNRLYGLLNLFRKYGIETYCDTSLIGLWAEGDRIIGAAFTNGYERFSVKAKLTIDATSDGHAVRMTGVPTRFGRDRDGKPVPFCTFAEYITQDGSVKRFNRDCGICNQYDEQDLSEKILSSHSDFPLVHSTLGHFLSVAPQIGVREGLSFRGEETLSYKDIISDASPEKVLFYAYSDLDKHGHDTALDDKEYQDWWVISNLATVTVRIPVPLGAVVPKGIKGLVTAGRCLSADSYALSAVRMNRDMYRMGECVGIAAALAVQGNTDFQTVDYTAYQKEAIGYGCYLGDGDKKFGFDKPNRPGNYHPVLFNLSVRDILEKLATDCPGPAIYAAIQNGSSLLNRELTEGMKSENSLLASNCALALGGRGDKTASPKLREIIRNRDCFYFKDCRRSNQFRSVIAICLLGRLGEKEDISLLSDIVFDPSEFDRPLYHTLAPAYEYCGAENCNFVYYQFFTHAVVSLLAICQRIDPNGLKEKYTERMKSLFSGDSRNLLLSRVASSENRTNPCMAEEMNDFMDFILK